MPTTAESIRQMLLAYVRGDDAGFKAAAEALIEQERRKNHHILAKDLARIIAAEGASPQAFERVGRTYLGDVPRDGDRGAPLVEIYSEPERELESLVLNPELRSALNRVVHENRERDILSAYGLRPIGKVLFFGPPGCGKTAAAAALAKELYLPLALVRFDAVISSYLGETASNLRAVFEFARSRPLVLLFDEFDVVGKRRSDGDDHGELKRVVSSFLQMLDAYVGDSLIIAATNHESLLDSAIWRRFDETLRFPKPTARQIETVLAQGLRQIGVARSLHLAKDAKSLVGFSFADIERIALTATKSAILTRTDIVTPGILKDAIRRQRDRIPGGKDPVSVKPQRTRSVARKKSQKSNT